MGLPRNPHELDQLFRVAAVPEVSDFRGEFYVDMLIVLPSLRRFSHRKRFMTAEDGTVTGYNLLFKKFRWGRFILKNGDWRDGAAERPAVLIDYNVPGNWLSRPMRDYVRRLEMGELYLGRFNYVVFGREIFLGYFSLSRKP